MIRGIITSKSDILLRKNYSKSIVLIQLEQQRKSDLSDQLVSFIIGIDIINTCSFNNFNKQILSYVCNTTLFFLHAN